MPITTIITWILGTLGVIGGFISIGFYGYGKWKKEEKGIDKENEDAKDNALNSNTETLELLTGQVEALQNAMRLQEAQHNITKAAQDEKIDRLTLEIHNLKTMIEEKDKKLSDTLAILQNRNPQFEEFMKTMILHVTKSETFMLDIKNHLDKQDISIGHMVSVGDRLLGVPGVPPVTNKV